MTLCRTLYSLPPDEENLNPDGTVNVECPTGWKVVDSPVQRTMLLFYNQVSGVS